MAKYIKIPEYAKKIGVSPQYIRRIISKGIITKKSLKRKGKRWLVNPESADQDQEKNLSSINRKADPKKKPEKKPGKETVIPNAEEKEKVIEKAGVKIFDSLSDAQKFKETYQGALKKLDLEERTGQLISRAERDQQDFNTARTVRDALLNIPDRICSILAAETDDSKVSEFLTKEIRQALEVLSK